MADGLPSPLVLTPPRAVITPPLLDSLLTADEMGGVCVRVSSLNVGAAIDDLDDRRAAVRGSRLFPAATSALVLRVPSKDDPSRLRGR
jgi:hypothetical protein